MKSLNEIQEAYNKKAYEVPAPPKIETPKNGIIDEEKSVRWNKEECERLKKEKQDKHVAWRKALADKEGELRSDVRNVLEATYNFSIKQAQAVEAFTWENHHSSMGDYFLYLDETAEFAQKLLKTP